MDPRMTLQKEPYFLAFMPVGPVHIEVDGIASECSEHMPQYPQESLPVAPGCAYQSFPAQQWRHPTGQVEPLPMLAGGGNSGGVYPAWPTPAPSEDEG